MKPKMHWFGFALLEALIAFAIIGGGILVLAPAITNTMGSSGLSKARSEALEIARGQNEIFRNYAVKGQFDQEFTAFSGGASQSRSGVNATFTLTAQVSPTTGNYRTVTTQVAWTDPKAGAQNVRLATQIYFDDPALASMIQDASCDNGENCRSLASPFVSGVEGADPSTPTTTTIPDVTNPGIAGTAVDNVTIRSYANGNVEVRDASGTVRLTAFGGIVHKIEGTIWLSTGARSVIVPPTSGSGSETLPLRVRASSPAWCIFPICSGSDLVGDIAAGTAVCRSGVLKAKYVCYVPGDCTKGGYNCPCNADDPGCTNGLSADFFGKDYKGGWHGSVGNFSVYLDPDDAVCTYDTNLAGGSALRLTPSREYTSYRVSNTGAPASCTASGVVSAVETRLDPWPNATYTTAYQPAQDQPIGPIELNQDRDYKGFCASGSPKAITATEGINASFSYQDFVVVRKSGSASGSGCTTAHFSDTSSFPPSGLIGLILPPSSIGRALNNPADTTGTYHNKSVPPNTAYSW